MTERDEGLLVEAFRKGFKEAHTDGLLQGSKAISGVILKKITEGDKSPEERLKEIKTFCEVSLSMKDKTNKESDGGAVEI